MKVQVFVGAKRVATLEMSEVQIPRSGDILRATPVSNDADSRNAILRHRCLECGGLGGQHQMLPGRMGSFSGVPCSREGLSTSEPELGQVAGVVQNVTWHYVGGYLAEVVIFLLEHP